jgi:hypothetical protein
MDLTDIKPTIIDCEESQRILPKPRSYTFDNPALVRVLQDHSVEMDRISYINSAKPLILDKTLETIPASIVK